MFKHHYGFTMPPTAPINVAIAPDTANTRLDFPAAQLKTPPRLKPRQRSVTGLLTIATLLTPWIMAAPVRADAWTESYTTCRLVDANARPDLLIVREAASADADAIETLLPNTRVTLNPYWRSIPDSYGYYWVEIVEPVEGFIANRPVNDETYSTLRNCPYIYTPSTNPQRVPFPGSRYDAYIQIQPLTNNPLYTYCQEVVESEGLTIRSHPSEASEAIGEVTEGRNVLVASDTEPVLDLTGRYWIAIDLPTPGYIAGGYSRHLENIEPCRQDTFPR